MVNDCQKDTIRNILNYYLTSELFSLEQDNFKILMQKIIDAKTFNETIYECRAELNDKEMIDAFKIYIGIIKVKDLIDYLQSIGILESDDESLEDFRKNKNFISLGYFYITKNGHLITFNDKSMRYLPIIPIIQIFKEKKDLQKTIKEYVEKKEDIENLFNKAFLDRWKIDESEPYLCYVVDSSVVLSDGFDANELKNLKNCVLCVTSEILSEIDELKKKPNQIKASKAKSFRAIFDDMAKQAFEKQDGNLSDGMWYPSKEEKSILIKMPSYPNLDKNEYGVDSLADASVIKATVEMSKKYYPILLSMDRTIRLGVQKYTSCFWQSGNLITDISISSRRLSYLKRYNSIEDLGKEETFFFEYFNVLDLLEKTIEGLKTFHFFFKGTSIAVEKVEEIKEKRDNKEIYKVNYKKIKTELEYDSTNQIFEDITELIKSNMDSKLLNTYICGRALETELTSIKTTVETFVSQDIPLAKWFSPFNAWLMQQIAINYADRLSNHDLIAVNGPPGTGKTTLLKDIIANIVVKRAIAIVEIKYDIFHNGKINSKLKNFGVVVTSNNNAAVENISIELPQMTQEMKEILENIKENDFRYFEDLVSEYFNLELNSNNQAESLEDKEELDLREATQYEYLGLLSLPLGNKDKRIKAIKLLNILIDYLNNLASNVSYEEIKAVGGKILELKSKIEYYSQKHKNYYLYISKIPELEEIKKTLEANLSEFESNIIKLKEKYEALNEELNKLQNKNTENQGLLSMHIKIKPSILKELLSMFIKKFKKDIKEWEKRYLSLCLEIDETKEKIQIIENNKKDLETKIKSVELKHNELIKKIEDVKTQIKYLGESVESIQKDIGSMLLSEKLYFKSVSDPENLTEDEKEKIYKFTPYKHEELNKLRIKIFIEALKLHKLLIYKNKNTFLDILNIFKGFLSNPDEFTNNRYSVDDLFDVFFFIIPVTSTTFASFSILFKQLSKSQIGYLMVDEAGQATPHSVLMPLYKSQRAVVVGDPLQIEPVINIPINLDKFLIKSFNLSKEFSVTFSSVQTLADYASKNGATFGNLRIGIPLNIHIRCNNPMFKIANRIAYANRMIKGAEDKWSDINNETNIKDLVPNYLKSKIPQSLWIHVRFDDSEKEEHTVINEILTLKKLLHDIEENLKRKNIDIAEFIKQRNIFIITPFRSISNYIDKKLNSTNLEKAISERRFIGTIHTFQGKEANIVIIVLGGRWEKSISWVASKPNMLNVALTRAKEFCFIIGDKDRWKKQEYFKCALEEIQCFELFNFHNCSDKNVVA